MTQGFFCKNTEYYINQSSKWICITQDCKSHLNQRASYSLQMQHPLPSDQESKLCKKKKKTANNINKANHHRQNPWVQRLLCVGDPLPRDSIRENHLAMTPRTRVLTLMSLMSSRCASAGGGGKEQALSISTRLRREEVSALLFPVENPSQMSIGKDAPASKADKWGGGKLPLQRVFFLQPYRGTACNDYFNTSARGTL